MLIFSAFNIHNLEFACGSSVYSSIDYTLSDFFRRNSGSKTQYGYSLECIRYTTVIYHLVISNNRSVGIWTHSCEFQSSRRTGCQFGTLFLMRPITEVWKASVKVARRRDVLCICKKLRSFSHIYEMPAAPGDRRHWTPTLGKELDETTANTDLKSFLDFIFLKKRGRSSRNAIRLTPCVTGWHGLVSVRRVSGRTTERRRFCV